MFPHLSILNSSLLLNNILLDEYTTMCLSFFIFMGFGLPWLLLIRFLGTLYCLDINPLSDVQIIKIFSKSLCSFTQLFPLLCGKILISCNTICQLLTIQRAVEILFRQSCAFKDCPPPPPCPTMARKNRCKQYRNADIHHPFSPAPDPPDCRFQKFFGESQRMSPQNVMPRPQEYRENSKNCQANVI